MDIYAKKGAKVKYVGTCDEAVKWGSNTDPRGLLSEGEIYTVDHTEVHTWHTKVYLEGVDGKFNSTAFEDYKEA